MPSTSTVECDGCENEFRVDTGSILRRRDMTCPFCDQTIDLDEEGLRLNPDEDGDLD